MPKKEILITLNIIEKNKCFKKRSVNLTLEQFDFIVKNKINLSEITRALIDSLIQDDKKVLDNDLPFGMVDSG